MPASGQVFIDLETRSRVDLRKSNVYRYVEDPDFLILMMAYADGDDEVQLTTDPVEITTFVVDWITQGRQLVAHNATFERIALSEHLRRYRSRMSNRRAADLPHRVQRALPAGQYLDPALFEDSMALAQEAGYPASLDALAQWLGGEQKDSAGTRLINMFSKPNRKGGFTTADEKPLEWMDFCEYCIQDVETLRSVYRDLPGWPTRNERIAWLTDQEINDRGIRVDVELAQAAVDAADENRMEQELVISTLTGVVNPGSTQQLLPWLQGAGVPIDNLRAETVANALSRDDLDPVARRVLELRQELALVASKKYIAALDRVNPDNRLRGSFQFFGAHTGRWAGRGVQLQNLPAASITPQGDETVDEAIAAQALDVTLGLGGTAHTLKALVRSMFVGPFTVVDYSAIEARVVAWIAGEDWALQAFAAGRDIYVETAKRMGGLTRKEGKVATLALGYNGGVKSLEAMGASGSQAYLQGLVTQWREANEHIVALWQELDHAFWRGDQRVGPHLSVVKDEGDRFIQLPSGRHIAYHGVRRQWGVNKWGHRVPMLSFRDPKRGGGRVDTYGGRLVENATQAIARDVLTDALIALEAKGYAPVGHVHDEILVEGLHPVEEVSAIMTSSSPWAQGLPLAAEGYQCPRYRKD